MKILIACEELQTICNQMRLRGHECYSADLQECSGGHPEWDIKGDVIPLINGRCSFVTMDGVTHYIDSKWDLMIAHPPCTYLTISGNRWFNVEVYGKLAIERIKKREAGAEFFMKFVNADCNRIAIENPVGIMSIWYRHPDQIIHPYYFGDHARKRTCLWLKNLPLLKPTNIVDYGDDIGRSFNLNSGAWHVCDENGKILGWNDPETAKIRSKTYLGIAKAIADQWGNESLLKNKVMSCKKFW